MGPCCLSLCPSQRSVCFMTRGFTARFKNIQMMTSSVYSGILCVQLTFVLKSTLWSLFYFLFIWYVFFTFQPVYLQSQSLVNNIVGSFLSMHFYYLLIGNFSFFIFNMIEKWLCLPLCYFICVCVSFVFPSPPSFLLNRYSLVHHLIILPALFLKYIFLVLAMRVTINISIYNNIVGSITI